MQKDNLPSQLFRAYEPRNVFPFFANLQNHLSYVLRETYVPTFRQSIKHSAKLVLKRDRRVSASHIGRLLIDSQRGIRLNFRGAFFSRNGQLLGVIPEFASLRYFQSFDINVNQLLAKAGIPIQDGLFLAIADRPVKLDSGMSTGTLSAVYRGPSTFTCYRNSIFARPVNEFSHHRPQGFRSLAPQMLETEEMSSSAFFCNFSSDLQYRYIANPTVRLHRSKDEFLEAKFGEIPPFGGHERTLEQLFGSQVRSFLAPFGGYGTLVAEEKGVTLSSIHLIRNHRVGTVSIEHTRPTHMYVV